MQQLPFCAENIRTDFPIFQRKIYEKPLTYLDSAASAQKPRCVIEKMCDTLESHYANVHRGIYLLSDAMTHAYEKARESVQKFINASCAQEIVFTKNATEAVNLVAYSWGMQHLKPGDEVILSVMEHHSNLVPWHLLKKMRGIHLKFVSIDEERNFDTEAFQRAFNARTKLVAITHMSNVLGSIVPIKQIVQFSHAQGVPVLVDGAQAAPRLRVDVQHLGADWYVFTGHKLYGPTGIGVLYAKKAVLQDMPPFLGGGQMIESVTTEDVSYANIPYRFEAGTPPIVEAIGLAQALAYLQQFDMNEIFKHEQSLLQYTRERMRAIKGLQLYMSEDKNGGIISFVLDGVHPHDLAAVLDREGIAIRAGTHCAQPLLKALGVSSICRVSFGIYNTSVDIDCFIEGIQKARRFFNV